MSTFPDGLYQYGGVPVGSEVMGLSMGNVYWVVQSTHAAYQDVRDNKQGQYHNDGSWRVHTTIQSALDATVTNRNDYVVVLPDGSDYDLTATLTLTKNRVHLVAPSGFGTHGFPTNSVRIDQTTAATAIFTVTGDCVEIGGFFLKGSLSGNMLVLSDTRWHPVIHDNFFGVKASDASSACYAVGGTGAINHFSIYDNYFTNYSPTLMTGTNNALAAFISISSNTSTRGLIRGNLMHPGANTTVGAGILCAAYGGFIIGNYLWEDTAHGGSDAGVFTLGISNATNTFCADNRIGIATEANAVAGGTADQSYCHNFEATAGGTAAV